MDPNEALTTLRGAMDRLGDYQAGLFPRPDLDDAITDATASFAALDGWLKRDGFVPADWLSDDQKAVEWVHSLDGTPCASGPLVEGDFVCADHDRRIKKENN